MPSLLSARLTVGRRIAGVIATLVAGVLLLAGCGLPRILPDRADPQVYASLDICGVVPIEDLRKDHPDVGMQPTFTMPAACVVRLDADWSESITISIVGSKVPDAIRTRGGDGVSDESVDGGTVVDIDDGESCGAYSLTDSGIWLGLWAHADDREVPGPMLCGLTHSVARSVVAKLRDGVPTIRWPKESLFTKDVCGKVTDSGMAESLGFPGDPTVHPTHLECSYSVAGSDPGPLWGLDVSVEISGAWPDDPILDRKRLMIAGRQVELDDTQAGERRPTGGAFCSFSIDFGPNREVRDRHHDEDREILSVSLMTRGPYDCESAVPAVSDLVEQLG